MAKTTSHIDPRIRLGALCERVARLDLIVDAIVTELDAIGTEFGAPDCDDLRVQALLEDGFADGSTFALTIASLEQQFDEMDGDDD